MRRLDVRLCWGRRKSDVRDSDQRAFNTVYSTTKAKWVHVSIESENVSIMLYLPKLVRSFPFGTNVVAFNEVWFVFSVEGVDLY